MTTTTAAPAAPQTTAGPPGRLPQTTMYVIEFGLVAVGLVLCMVVGVDMLGLGTVWDSLWASDGSHTSLIVRSVRLPRALLAMTVGGGLAAAGALMQGMTRNPLASPTIFGINAGAALAVVAGLAVSASLSTSALVWLAFGGAAAAGSIVVLMAAVTRGGLTPFRLTIAGAAIAALLISVTQGLLVMSEQTLDQAKRWLVGSLSNRAMDELLSVLPFVVVGVVLAAAVARSLTTLSLGEDLSKALGVRTRLVKSGSAAAVVLLAGSAVAVAGPITFVGLAVPHITRYWVGLDYRRLIPHTILQGAALVLLADALARFAIRPQELPVGVVTAIVGGPIFVRLARQGMKQI